MRRRDDGFHRTVRRVLGFLLQPDDVAMVINPDMGNSAVVVFERSNGRDFDSI